MTTRASSPEHMRAVYAVEDYVRVYVEDEQALDDITDQVFELLDDLIAEAEKREV
jgi:hypothetical protein